MPNILQHPELERRLLRWTGSSSVPRYPFFEGPYHQSPSLSNSFHLTSSSLEDLRRWFNDIELAASDCDVSVEQYPDVAIYFMKGDLKEVMKERREVYAKQTRRVFWDWRDFKEDLKRIVEEAAKIISSSTRASNIANDAMEQLRLAHPYIASSVRLGLIVGGTVVLLPTLGLMAWKRLSTSVSPAIINSPHY